MQGEMGLRGVICRNKGCDDVKIAECRAESAATKELFFCDLDGCYFAKAGGGKRPDGCLPSMVRARAGDRIGE